MAEHTFDDVDFSPFIRNNYFNTSIEELINQAKENNKFAAYELGQRYKRSRDIQQALKYFTLSANLGDIDAPLEAALILNEQKRYKEAVPFLEMSIQRKNSPLAHTILGKYYARFEIGGLFKAPKLGFQHFLAAAQQGYPEAQYLLALNYFQGKGTKASNNDFTFWMRCAMLNGHQRAIDFMNDFFRRQGNPEFVKWWRAELVKQDAKISEHPEYIEEYFRQQIKQQKKRDD